ncbi:MAG: GumC family protein [bacterium]
MTRDPINNMPLEKNGSSAEQLLSLLGQKPQIDIKQLWFVLMQRKWWVIVTSFLVTAGSIIYALLYIRPIFEASSTIRIAPSRLYRSVSGVTPGTSQNVNYRALQGRVLSVEFLALLGRRLELDKNEEIKDVVKAAKERAPGIPSDQLMDRMLAKFLKGNLSISTAGAELFNITARHSQPEMAYYLSKTLTEIFVDESKKSELSGIRGVKEFSDEQLAIYKKKVEDAEEKLKLLHKRIAVRYASSVTGRSDSLGSLNMYELKSKADIAISRRQNLLLKAQSRLPKSIKVTPWEQIPPLRPVKIQIDNKIEEFKKRVTMQSWQGNYELVMNNEFSLLRMEANRILQRWIPGQYKSLGRDAYQNIQTYLLGEIDLYIFRAQQSFAEQMLSNFVNVAAAKPEEDFELKKLHAEIEQNRAVYDLFFKHSRGSQIEEALQNSDMDFKYSIVEQARIPLNAVSGSKKVFVMTAFALSLGLGIAFVFGLEFIDQSIKTVEDVERDLKIPVWGIVPKINTPFSDWHEALRKSRVTAETEQIARNNKLLRKDRQKTA